MPRFSRRQFLAASAAGLGALGLSRAGLAKRGVLPKPEQSGIKHIVVVMVENRSFDHLLGWLPNADGIQEGLVFTDAAGTQFPTHALSPDFQGCRFADPDHT